MRFVLSICLLVSACWSQAQYQSLFWKISGNGLAQPSFLYGTMHVSDARVFNFSDSVMPAFSSCSAYAMELDMAEATGFESLGKMMMGKNLSIKKMIPAEQYHTLDSIFKIANKGLSVKLFDNFSPILLQTMIELQSMGVSDSFIEGNSEALDVYFNTLAKKQKKKVIGIEKMSEQLQALNTLSYKEQAKMLTESLKELEAGKEKEYDVMRYYVQQDLDSLLLMNNVEPMPKKFYEALITNRNARMAKRIANFIPQQSTFIAVGALHLPGEDGVIALLRKQGFSVEPMK